MGAHEGLEVTNSWLHIIHHDFGLVTHRLNAHAYFYHTYMYGITGCKYEERKHYKTATALRIYKGRTKLKG